MDKAKSMDFIKKYTMIIVLILLVAFFTWQTSGDILLPMNVSALISQNSYVFILATGMLLCILTGGNIDLSIGSLVCFVGAVGAEIMVNKGVNMYVTILVMVLVGTLVGAWQGFWIAFVRIPPFITTLAGMLVFRGLSNIVLNGMTVPLNDQTQFLKIFGGGADCYIPDFFGEGTINLTCIIVGVLASVAYIFIQYRSRIERVKKGYEVGKFGSFIARLVIISAVILVFAYRLSEYKGIPTVLIWVFIIVLIYGYITSNTTFGRYFYAVGGNEKATKLSGINTNKVYFGAYLNMGFLSAIAAMVTIARLSSAQPTYGQNYEMDAIGACFIGGASAYGGIGTVPGVIIGAVLMGVINIGMSLMGIGADEQKVVKGKVLLAAVNFDVVSKRGGKIMVKN